jgi:anti-anti-sigma factor
MSVMEVEHIDGVPIAHVRQDIDAATVLGIQTQLDGTLGPDAFSLIVDLAETGYIDSAGIDMLLRLGERLGQRRAALMLVIPAGSQISRLAGLVGLDQAHGVHGTVQGALQAAAELPRSRISLDGTLAQPDMV